MLINRQFPKQLFKEIVPLAFSLDLIVDSVATWPFVMAAKYVLIGNIFYYATL